MKVPTMLPVVALLALLTFSCSTDAVEEEAMEALASSYVPDTKIIEIEIMELINEYRIGIGLNSLQDMSEIKSVAYSHTDYMIDNSIISHDNFYLRQASLENNVGALRVGENVAYGYQYAESVVNAWLNSQGHKYIIEGDYTHFDISAEQDQNDRWYYTNIFLKK